MEEVTRYRNAALVLAYDLALLSLMADRARRGRLTGLWFAEETLSRLKGDVPEFLSARREAGLDGSRGALKSFCDDALFDGFSLTDGRFLGSADAAEKVCGVWVRKFNGVPTEDEAARFEIGAVALMLSGCAQEIFARRAETLTGESYEEWLSGAREFPRLANDEKAPEERGLWARLFARKGERNWERGIKRKKKRARATRSSSSEPEEPELTF